MQSVTCEVADTARCQDIAKSRISYASDPHGDHNKPAHRHPKDQCIIHIGQQRYAVPGSDGPVTTLPSVFQASLKGDERAISRGIVITWS
jgi:hypothetical protein